MRGIYLLLYLVMDVWSRRIVGWRIAAGDSALIAVELVTQPCRQGNLDPRGLVLHSDGWMLRGGARFKVLDATFGGAVQYHCRGCSTRRPPIVLSRKLRDGVNFAPILGHHMSQESLGDQLIDWLTSHRPARFDI